jgi:hypothetical protein
MEKIIGKYIGDWLGKVFLYKTQTRRWKMDVDNRENMEKNP